MKNKICVIKLGALGDVIRTLPILEAIKQKYPDSEISWITKKPSLQVLENNPLISKVLSIPVELDEKFDILYNFDIEEDACSLASKIKADKKLGFYYRDNYPAAFNIASEYYLNTLFDDETKKTNKKTHQEMIFKAAELEWKKQKIHLYLTEEDKKYAENFSEKNNLQSGKLIGLHIGSSPRWPSKAWHEDKIKEFIIKAKEKGYEILLLAGPDDINKKEIILSELKKEGLNIPVQDTSCTLREFASLVNLCSLIICSDSLAQQVSLAMNKKTICLFFCTSPNEIEGYGLLTKIVSPMLPEFFPEKSDQYSEALVSSISSDEVLNATEKILKNWALNYSPKISASETA